VISKRIETNREVLRLLEFIRLDYCSTDTMIRDPDGLKKSMGMPPALDWLSQFHGC
jgi:hypothetical protein